MAGRRQGPGRLISKKLQEQTEVSVMVQEADRPLMENVKDWENSFVAC